jgi:hypothetical protein
MSLRSTAHSSIKGAFKGVLLSLCVLSVRNTYHMVAFAVAISESADAYEFFLRTCFEGLPALQNLPHMVIVSDRDKGLGPAQVAAVLAELFKGVLEHVWCVLHLVENALTHCRKRGAPVNKAQLQRLMFAAAKAPTESAFGVAMVAIQRFSQEAFDYLMGDNIDVSKWTAAFSVYQRHHPAAVEDRFDRR